MCHEFKDPFVSEENKDEKESLLKFSATVAISLKEIIFILFILMVISLYLIKIGS